MSFARPFADRFAQGFASPFAERRARSGGGSQPPSNLTPPRITRNGTVLTCDPGTWSNSPDSFTFRWLLNGTAFIGATSAVWAAPPSVWSSAFGCEVVPRNSAGQGMPALAQEVYIGYIDVMTAKPFASWSFLSRNRAAYAGAGTIVRNSATDPASQDADIGFTASGLLNNTTLSTHVGSGGGGIVQCYDQIGNNQLFQGSAINQPRIANAGVIDTINGRPMPIFDGVNDFMLSTQNIGLSGDPIFTINMVQTMVLPSFQAWLYWGNDTPGSAFYYMGANTGQNLWTGYSSQTQNSTITVPNSANLASMTIMRTGTGGAAWTIRRNGAALSITPGNNNAVTLANSALLVGRWPATGSLSANMSLAEINIFQGVPSDADLQIMERTQGRIGGHIAP